MTPVGAKEAAGLESSLRISNRSTVIEIPLWFFIAPSFQAVIARRRLYRNAHAVAGEHGIADKRLEAANASSARAPL
jgi:hypothetical protein